MEEKKMLTKAMMNFDKMSDITYHAAEEYNRAINALNDFGDYRDYDDEGWALEKIEELENMCEDLWEDFADSLVDLRSSTDENVDYAMYKDKIASIYIGINDGWDIG